MIIQRHFRIEIFVSGSASSFWSLKVTINWQEIDLPLKLSRKIDTKIFQHKRARSHKDQNVIKNNALRQN